jgi:hypothetical protein
MIREVPAKLRKNSHDYNLPPSASVLEQWSLLLPMQHKKKIGKMETET